MNTKKNTNSAERRRRKQPSVLRQHKRSVLLISAIMVLLTGVLSVNAARLYQKNQLYKQQEAELRAQIEDEKARSKEVEEYEEYVKTDEYIKDVAEKKLGLVDPNEIIFQASE